MPSARLRRRRSALLLVLPLLLGGCAVRIGSAPDGAAHARATRTARPSGAPGDTVRWGGGSAVLGTVARPAVAAGALLIPVAGVGPEQLRDSYRAPRDGGARRHHAIDIMAPRNTPVLAAADGTVWKLRRGGKGGIAIHQLTDDGRTVLYYAHLSAWAAGLHEGQRVRRGQTLGYVGDTGNARGGPTHLHFSVGLLRDPDRWWETDNVNPYPLLVSSASADVAVGGR